MSKDNGGPAFPLADSNAEYMNTSRQECNGMTLRHYYMAHAPFTLNDARTAAYAIGGPSPSGEQLIELLAQMRAAYADAMIAEGLK